MIDSSRKRFAGLAPAPVPAPTAMKLIETEEFSIPKVTGVLSRAAGISELSATGSAHMRLPLGMPRFVNVATLKRMLKAKRTETMLRRVGDQWEVCEDATQVDLLDDSVEFRLGAVQIFS
ncbi:MAG TPA: hypothetical protein VFB00_08175 [Terriglobales bacterium]|nr:hypothetical protein [Terriglobales bacterium]